MKLSQKFVEANASKEYLDKIEELTQKVMSTKGLSYDKARTYTIEYLIQNDIDDEMVKLRFLCIKKYKIVKF